MPETTTHASGTFCWPELSTTDPWAAKRFYTTLFGWEHEDYPAGGDCPYTILRSGGRDVGALTGLPAAQREQGVPPAWLDYVSVESADAGAARVGELGGQVLAGPFDVMENGRMAVVRDPQGAVFALWEAKAHHGAGVLAEPGAMCWVELATTDPEAAKRFYGGLFGWEAAEQQYPHGVYSLWLRHDPQAPAGGMYRLSGPMEGVPPHWLVYFSVADCDGTVDRAKALGASVVIPPSDIPDVGRFAYLRDPQGAMFAVIRLVEWRGEQG
jgi:predicted enzyme related to lactoylglutathione lyase